MLKKIKYIFLLLIPILCISGFKNKSQTRDFDFYVLSLSWSPEFCATRPDDNSEQCRRNSNFGFVVHGLWPNFERGFPRNCETKYPNPSAGLISQMQDIMPSRRLVNIQWERHGTCSGLNPNDYFNSIKNAYKSVNIPNYRDLQSAPSVAAIEQKFIGLNPKLKKDMIAVVGKNGSLSEVRVCMDKSLNFRVCSEVNSKGAKDFERIFIQRPR